MALALEHVAQHMVVSKLPSRHIIEHLARLPPFQPGGHANTCRAAG